MRLIAQDRIENPGAVTWSIFWRVWLLSIVLILFVRGVLRYVLSIFLLPSMLDASATLAANPALDWLLEMVAYAVGTHFAVKLTLKWVHGKALGNSAFLLATFENKVPVVSQNADRSEIAWQLAWRYVLLTTLLNTVVAVSGQFLAAATFADAFGGPTLLVAIMVMLTPGHFLILKWIICSLHKKDFGGSTFLVATVHNDEVASHAN